MNIPFHGPYGPLFRELLISLSIKHYLLDILLELSFCVVSHFVQDISDAFHFKQYIFILSTYCVEYSIFIKIQAANEIMVMKNEKHTIWALFSLL